MAATQKTLTPTNEVISIPAFTDKPDYRLPIDSTGKLADAINVLDSKIFEFLFSGENKQTITITVPNNSSHELIICGGNPQTRALVIITDKTSASISGRVFEIAKGSNTSYTASDNTITVDLGANVSYWFVTDKVLRGNAVTVS